MSKTLALLMMVAFVQPMHAAGLSEARAADPAPPPIIVPDTPVPPVPPVPSSTPLAADQMYVIRANVQCTVLASPLSLVKITSDKGPVKIKAKFTDGNGTYQCRTYAEPFIYEVEANGKGRCELIIVPAGAAGESDIVRRVLDVGGSGPVPPGPGPTPPTDPFTTALQAAYATDPDPAKAIDVAWAAKVIGATPAYLDPAVGMAQIKTVGDLFGSVHTALHSPPMGFPQTGIVPTMKVIDGELTTVFGTDPTKALNVTIATAEMNKIAAALKSLTGAAK